MYNFNNVLYVKDYNINVFMIKTVIIKNVNFVIVIIIKYKTIIIHIKNKIIKDSFNDVSKVIIRFNTL